MIRHTIITCLLLLAAGMAAGQKYPERRDIRSGNKFYGKAEYSEAEISYRKALEKLGDVTKIIIAQRISSVIHTDRIVILDDGKIHNIGTHEQLLKEDAIYQEIYASQMKGGNSDGIENEEC